MGPGGHPGRGHAQFKSTNTFTGVLSHSPLHSSAFSSNPSHVHPSPQHLLLFPFLFLPRWDGGGGVEGGSRLKCHLLMDGGGLSPGACWAVQNQNKTKSWAPPPTLRGCQNTVGTVCLSGPAKGLKRDCQRGLKIQYPVGMESGGLPQLTDKSDSCSNFLESHYRAEG